MISVALLLSPGGLGLAPQETPIWFENAGSRIRGLKIGSVVCPKSSADS